MAGKLRGSFNIKESEYSSPEYLLTVFSILESRGYNGLSQLMAVIDDPMIILKIVRVLYGLDIQIPPLKEFVKCLKASTYIYCDMHKNVNATTHVKPADIRQHMNISEEEEKELLKIFDEWVIYMHKHGRDVREYLHINRNNTKKRIDMAIKGKQWTNRY